SRRRARADRRGPRRVRLAARARDADERLLDARRRVQRDVDPGLRPARPPGAIRARPRLLAPDGRVGGLDARHRRRRRTPRDGRRLRSDRAPDRRRDRDGAPRGRLPRLPPGGPRGRPAPSAAGALGVSATRAIVVSIDGLAAFYFRDPAARMPGLRALAERGVVAARMETVFPSTTWPTHVSLVTGVAPDRHGVVGNSVLNRGTGAREDLTGDPVYDAPDLLRAPTIYDVAHAAGFRTA